MSSLYKRATPSQSRILRAVEGAVRNASHAHPDIRLGPSFAKSVAKRAAGTLTAQWPDVLAARAPKRPTPSDKPGAVQVGTTRSLRTVSPGTQNGRGASQALRRRSPLYKLWKLLSALVKPAKNARQTERVATLIEVLKMISEIQRQEERSSK